MSQTLQNAHIQVKLPGDDGMCDFPLGNETRFSDMFRTLIAKGYFTVPENEHPVWVLLCGDQDLVTWNSADHTFFDRFPFGEPPILNVPNWITQTVHFVSYPDSLARAKAIYLYFQGNKSFMGHEGVLTEYRSYHVPATLEARWRAQYRDANLL